MEIYNSERGRWAERHKDPERGKKADTEKQMCIHGNVFFEHIK